MLRRIEQEIEKIEQAIAATKAKQASIYHEYVQVFSQALQQESILSVYRVCTQDYPDRFLALSMSARQELQHDVQILARAMADDARKTLDNLGSDNANNPPSQDRSGQAELDTLLAKILEDATDAANQLLVKTHILKTPVEENDALVSLTPAELEFTHQELMTKHNEWRSLHKRLLQLQDELAQQRQNQAIAEAEQTWRATWSEI
ncbi:hypothetical protein [Pseudanabaena sp. PCC 6802]|uniref:hypothetical protein n=1 Tax=Pseudanabaena sp. PCC 6802 TaxID=118173 RepID=UPI00034938CD|nr:hypothetical protein [Pseudanabaena sp. PCC 6802]